MSFQLIVSFYNHKGHYCGQNRNVNTLVTTTMAANHRQKRQGEDSSICSNTVLLILGMLCVLIGVLLVIIGSVRLHAAGKNCSEVRSVAKTGAKSTSPELRALCNFSTEAVRVGLPALLEEIKAAYFEHNPNNVAWMPDLQGDEMVEYVKTRCEVDVVMCSLALVDRFLPA